MAPPAEPPTTITLRIKVPPGHIEGGADEFTLGTEVPVSARVGEVRERIQRFVPSHPSPERQRLLYAGRALVDNEQSLSDALNMRRDPSQTEYVVHLLVKGDGTATAPLSHRRGLSTQGRASPVQAGQRAAPPSENAQQPPQAPLPHELHAHHNHIHQQHLQQHQAAMLAQHQQQHLLHNVHHNPLHAGPGPGLFPFGMPPMQFGAGLPMAPMRPQFAQPAEHGLPPQGAARVPSPAATQGQDSASAVHGSAESRPLEGSAQGLGPDGQQRSASQPPPRPGGRGVVIEGRGPNGERIHIQQHIQLGPQALLQHGLGLPLGQQLPQQQQIARRSGPTALEQARDSIAEMHRLLAELRALDAATDEQQERITRIQQRTQEVNNYIDPFGLGGSNANGARAANTAHEDPLPGSNPQPMHAQVNTQLPTSIQQQTLPSASNTDITCYLLSSREGPQALLLSPQDGAYTSQSHSTLQPTSTSQSDETSPAAHGQQPGALDQALAAQPPAGQAPPIPAPAAPQDDFGGFRPGIVNHMWLLMRVLIFAYFILGANLGWQRPLALAAIALGFWLLRQGPLAEGGVLRRWWDGIVQNPRAPPAAAAGQQQAQGAADARPGQMPTPEQVAQRLLAEDRQQRDNRLAWMRQQVRPAERAIALLVASLWPGVGEAYVRALEAEERRRNEEEIAARRREEEEQQKSEEESKRAAGAAEEGSSTDIKSSSAESAIGAVDGIEQPATGNGGAGSKQAADTT